MYRTVTPHLRFFEPLTGSKNVCERSQAPSLTAHISTPKAYSAYRNGVVPQTNGNTNSKNCLTNATSFTWRIKPHYLPIKAATDRGT